jgi:hypothetical protein
MQRRADLKDWRRYWRHGVVLVDTKTTIDSEKLVIAEIANITPKPITPLLSPPVAGDID